MTTIIDVSEGPHLTRKYEITADRYNGMPQGETVVANPDDPSVKRAVRDRALKLLDEPAYEDDTD